MAREGLSVPDAPSQHGADDKPCAIIERKKEELAPALGTCEPATK
jgi:hypothetical protein